MTTFSPQTLGALRSFLKAVQQPSSEHWIKVDHWLDTLEEKEQALQWALQAIEIQRSDAKAKHRELLATVGPGHAAADSGDDWKIPKFYGAVEAARQASADVCSFEAPADNALEIADSIEALLNGAEVADKVGLSILSKVSFLAHTLREQVSASSSDGIPSSSGGGSSSSSRSGSGK